MIVQDITSHYQHLQDYREATLERRRLELKNIVSLAEVYVRAMYQKTASGEMTEDVAKAQVIEMFKQFRYGKNDYLFIWDYQAVLVAHPEHELHGKSLATVKDARGYNFAPDLIQRARDKGEADVRYWWPRLNGSEPQEKLTYGKHFPEWEWILASGIYIDEIEAEYTSQLNALEARMRTAIQREQFADHGYLFIFDGKKRIIAHPAMGNQDLAHLSNPITGKILTDELMAAAAHPEQPLRYLWDKPGAEGQYIFEKEAYTQYLAPLDWYIGATVYMDDIRAPIHTLLLRAGSGMLLLLAALTVLSSWYFSHIFSRPMARLRQQLGRLAEYDLRENLAANDSCNEVSILTIHFNTMLNAFKEILKQVQQSGIQISSSATQLTATAKEQEIILNKQSASVLQVRDSVSHISSLAEELTGTILSVAEQSQEAAEFANHGLATLTNMKIIMDSMASASRTVYGRLRELDEKADKITTVVTTIARVADQTNLLSLNAAIEAEKAGEFGRGFTVVAQEIRRLADQTAMATLDIEFMVKEMQHAVSSGVAEMDKFISQVAHSGRETEQINIQLGQIIQKVQALSPSFQEVGVGMNSQCQLTQQIHRTMNELGEEFQQTMESLHDTHSAISQLSDAARGLKDGVLCFKM